VIRLLRAADRVAVPWKNGGGITREVTVWPAGSSFDTFDWRVSIAQVREAGPFSRFENIDRTMAILQGRLALRFADRTVELDANGEPFSFAGDVSCDGLPVDGPVTDLNVMVRRGRAVARVGRFATVDDAAAPRTLVLATALTRVRLADEEQVLGPLDAALVSASRFTAEGEGFVIAFR
jgi:environmental stress-induced protein Ves